MARFLQQFRDRWARRSRRFVAVDFDSRRLRVVYARRAGAGADLLKCHSVEIPADVSISDAAAFGPFLYKALKKLRLAGRPVLMSVPRSQAVLKPISLPAGTPETDVASMVHFQVDKELPFRIEDAVVDHMLGGGHYGDGSAPGEGVNVLVAAVRLPTVDYYRRLAEAGSFRLLRLGLRPSMTACCVRACHKIVPNESLATVHVGFDEIEISVLHGGALAFTRSVGVKSAAVPSAAVPSGEPPIPLAGELKAGEAASAELKVAGPKSGGKGGSFARGAKAAAADAASGAGSPVPATAASPAGNGQENGNGSGNGVPVVSSGPAVTTAAPEIARTLQSYQALQRQGRITKVLVTGETGIETALVDELSSRLKTPCELLVTRALECKGKPPDGALAAPLGLVLGHGADQFEFDFLDPRRPPVIRDTRKTKMAAGFLVSMVVIVGLLFANSSYLDGKNKELGAAVDSRKKLQEQDMALTKLSTQAKTVDGWARGRQDWLAHWAYLSELLPDAKDAYLQEIKIVPATNVPNARKGKPDEPVAVLDIKVRARDRAILMAIKDRLLSEEYTFPTPAIDPCNDQYGYPHEMKFSLTVPYSMIELSPPPVGEFPYRSEDDVSGDTFGRRPTPTPSANPSRPTGGNPGGPGRAAPAPPSTSYRDVRFDDLKRGAELLTQLNATPLAITGRLVAESNPKAFAPSTSADSHLVYRLEETQFRAGGGGGGGGRGGGGNNNSNTSTGRFVYVYVPKGAAMAQAIQRRNDRDLQRVRVEGRAHFTGDHPEACPAGLVAERIQ